MSAQALLKRFDIVADQSANIPALRRLVVDLAVRGKLLAANELDMDVQEMLDRISSKASELISAGTIKKLKLNPRIGNDEVPAAYLAHCIFARLGNIATLQKGLTGIQSSMPGEFPLVVTAAERGTCDHFDFDSAAAIIPLVSSTGHGNASINRLHYQDGKFALGTILCAVVPLDEQLVSARFLYEYLTAFKEELLVSKMIGTANVTLTLGKIAEVPVPILAPAVQRRVDELMAMCDQLEAAQQERERRRDRLAAASLQRLNQPAADTTPEAQRKHARFHLHHLPRLSTRPEHMKGLRDTFLELAMRGVLVSQEKHEGRVELTTTSQRIYPIADDEIPFDLPVSWAWIRLGAIAKLYNGDRGKNYPNRVEYVASGLPFINTGHIEPDGSLSVASMNYLTRKKFDSLNGGKIEPGDLVYCLRGATMGKTAFVAPFTEGAIASSLVIIRLDQMVVHLRFAYYFLTSPLGRSLIRRFDNGTAQPNLSAESVKRYLVPLPPLPEQRRIVAKVDELMALCDQLEAQLTATQTDSRRLLEAVLEAALTPA